ncbi:MAG: type II toxin-antitoxin system RelE/ParE family toxin [Anditalea sp.]
MTAFKTKIEPEAYQDIQEAIGWYNQQQTGLGRRFHTEVKASFKKLEIHPFFQVRYDNVHCFLLKKFPYMVHYTVDEPNKKIIVRAVLGTSRNPKLWKGRK